MAPAPAWTPSWQTKRSERGGTGGARSAAGADLRCPARRWSPVHRARRCAGTAAAEPLRKYPLPPPPHTHTPTHPHPPPPPPTPPPPQAAVLLWGVVGSRKSARVQVTRVERRRCWVLLPPPPRRRRCAPAAVRSARASGVTGTPLRSFALPCSGNSRQVMDLLDQEWKDPDIEVGPFSYINR